MNALSKFAGSFSLFYLKIAFTAFSNIALPKSAATMPAVLFNFPYDFKGPFSVGGATSSGVTSICGGSGSSVLILVDGDISAGLITDFGIGVSGSLGIILSLA
jgi:hypothetical protein